MGVTARDVARKAGVSTATVSRVINQSHRVSKELQTRVLQAMKELGHKPNLVARSLTTGKSWHIWLLITDILNPYFCEFAAGVQEHAVKKGYLVSVLDWRDASENVILDSLLERRIDGVIAYSGAITLKGVKTLAERGVPVVTPRKDLKTYARCVEVDETKGVKEALTHLRALGHEYIGFLASDEYWSASRLYPYRELMDDLGETAWRDMVLHTADSDEGGYLGIEQLLRKAPRLTAVMCYNDVMAIGAYRRLCELGIGVPEDMSLIGFDNISVSATTGVGLTTIDMPKHELGGMCASY
jgi:LacI family transcriptional regulator